MTRATPADQWWQQRSIIDSVFDDLKDVCRLGNVQSALVAVDSLYEWGETRVGVRAVLERWQDDPTNSTVFRETVERLLDTMTAKDHGGG